MLLLTSRCLFRRNLTFMMLVKAFVFSFNKLSFMQQRTVCRPAILLSAVILCAMRVCAPESATFYVATNGFDGWSGKSAAPNAAKSDGPFASLERARNEIRQLKKNEPLTDGATVFVRSGIYSLAQ